MDIASSQRIRLRTFEPDDAEEMFGVYGDADVMRYVAEGDAITSIAAVREMLHGYIAHQDLHGYGFWAIVDRKTSRLIGDAGFERHQDGEVELGYTIARSFWGMGFATEAARLCIATIRDHGVRNITALVDSGNGPSAHVAQKLGFVRDGTRVAYGRPHDLYRLTS